MGNLKKALVITLSLALLAGTLAIGASAAGATVKRVLFINAENTNQVKSVAATTTSPEYQVYTVNVEGTLEEIKVLKEPGYLGGIPTFLPSPWFGLFDITINAAGYVEKTRAVTEYVQGFNICAPKDGKIILGVKEQEYTFAEDARVFVGSKTVEITELEIEPEDIQDCWDGAYWLDLNDSGEIENMYISVTPNLGKTNKPLTDNIKKFDSAWGPEAEDGAKIGYNYFKPEEKEGVKYPLMIWFHGSGCGMYEWQSLFDYNAIANFASEDYQAEFDAGGAYVMTPRSNETWVGYENGMSKWAENLVPAFYAALDDFIEQHPDVDTDRIYVGGFSNGGSMTWLTIRERPDMFAAAFPNCPGGKAVPEPTDLKELSKFTYLPLWQIHGIADPVVPSSATTKIMPFFEAAAARTGTDTRFSLWEEHFVDPDGNKVPIDHLAWAPTLNNMLMNDGTLYLDKDDVAVKSTLIDWFNAQTRSANLARAAKNPYTDVSKDGWAYASIKNAFDTGIVVGVGGNKYEPDSPFTTAQWLTILYRFAKNSFDDKAAQGANWMEAAQYLNELLELEYDEAGLDAAITREEMAFIATKVLKYTDVEYKAIKDPIEFTDAEQITQEYKDAVTWFSSVGGINGIPEDEGAFSFNPGGNLKRSEAAQVAYNIINVLTVEPAA